MEVAARQQRKLLFVGFNQDKDCVVAGMENGFATYNSEPFAEVTHRKLETGGVGFVELLYRTNILALVGGGSVPQWPVSKVMIWDDSRRKCVGELGFHTPVRRVTMRRDLIVAVLDRKIYLYKFLNLQLITNFDTGENTEGLCSLSYDGSVVAFPAKELGFFRAQQLAEASTRSLPVEAHESPIKALGMNNEGTIVATASMKGTLIRVWDVTTQQLLHELRRGTDRAVIFSISMNDKSTLLACTSDKCTVHVFNIEGRSARHSQDENAKAGTGRSASNADGDTSSSTVATAVASTSTTNGGAIFNALPQNFRNIAGSAQALLTENIGDYIPKYFTTETRRSIVRFQTQATSTVCAFAKSQPNSILVCGLDGTFSQHVFDPESGKSERIFFGSVFSNE